MFLKPLRNTVNKKLKLYATNDDMGQCVISKRTPVINFCSNSGNRPI